MKKTITSHDDCNNNLQSKISEAESLVDSNAQLQSTIDQLQSEKQKLTAELAENDKLIQKQNNDRDISYKDIETLTNQLADANKVIEELKLKNSELEASVENTQGAYQEQLKKVEKIQNMINVNKEEKEAEGDEEENTEGKKEGEDEEEQNNEEGDEEKTEDGEENEVEAVEEIQEGEEEEPEDEEENNDKISELEETSDGDLEYDDDGIEEGDQEDVDIDEDFEYVAGNSSSSFVAYEGSNESSN